MSHVSRKRNASKILLRLPEGKRPLDNPRHRWKIILKCALKIIVFQNLDGICLKIGTSDRLLVEQLSASWNLKMQGST